MSYTYDGVGNMLTLTDPGGTTTYAYNAVNLPTTVSAPGMGLVSLGYDANYNRTSVAYPNGVTVYSTYDGANRLVRVNTVRGTTTVNDLNYSLKPSGPNKGSARPITMRGSPSTYATDATTTTGITLARPPELKAGDVAVAQISIGGNASITSVPAGWTLIRQNQTSTAPDGLRQALYYRVVGSSEPPRYTWGLSQAVVGNGALTGWAGVDPASPIANSTALWDPAEGTVYSAPSLAYQNGERALVFYGVRPLGATADISVPSGHTEVYDTVTNWMTISLDTRTLPAVAGTTGAQNATGPRGDWVAQHVLLRPQYDSAVRQSGPGGANTYDGLNRLTASGSYAYTYDGSGNRLSQALGTTTVNYTYNAANQLISTKPQISFVGATNGTATNASGFNVALPAGVQPGDQILASVVAQGTDTVAAAGYTEVANATSSGNPVVTLVGTSSTMSPAGSTATSYPINLPAGIQAADQILIAVTGAGNHTMSVSGYTQAAVVSGGSLAVDSKTVLYRKTAVGGETQATISAPLGSVTAAVASVYRNVDPANPIASQTTAFAYTTNTVTLPSLTPSQAGEHLVVVHGAADNTSPGTWSPPAGMTERVQRTNQTARSVGLADRALTSTAPTGTLTSTINSSAPPHLSSIGVLLRPAPAARTVVLRRTAVAGDTQVPITLSAGTTAAAVVAAYRGVDPADPIDVVTTAGASRTNTLTLPSLTPSAPLEHLLVFQGATNSYITGSWSPPATMLMRTQAKNEWVRSAGVADKALTSATATGPLTSTMSTSQPSWANVAGVALILRPDAEFRYDKNGNLTTSSGATLAYDAGDRTTSFTPAGASPTTFTYRAGGQSERATTAPAVRVAGACADIATCSPATSNLGASSTFVHSELGVSAETIGSSTTYYVRDPRGGLLGMRPPSGGPYYYLFDGQGSIVGLADPAGAVVATYGYDPYGRLTSLTSTGAVGVNNPWRYVGAYQDGSGLYKMGHRYYDPGVGRFTQQDPIYDPLDPKSWNRYVYVGGDPINFTDSTGLSWLDDVWNKAKCIAKELNPLDIGGGSGGFFEMGLVAGAVGAEAVRYSAMAGAVTGATIAASVPMLILGGGLMVYGGYKANKNCTKPKKQGSW